MNNIDYKTKYIKYKIKYLDFIKQYAGVPLPQQTIVSPLSQQTIVMVICSHSARLRCLLNSLGITSAIECRFKNCAILKFEIDNTNITISLVYEGEVEGEDGKKYYVKSKQNSNEEQFYTRTFNFDILSNSLHIKRDDIGEVKYVIYVMRHGDGTHNAAIISGDKTKLVLHGKLKDATLTQKGMIQAMTAGTELLKILHSDYQTIKYYFASDLYRTRQSLKFAFGAGIEIIVLPCSHELNFKNNDCDGHQYYTPQENMSSCNSKDKRTIPVIKDRNDVNRKFICDANWEFYDDFYYSSFLSRRQHCRDTSMISLCIFISKEMTARQSTLSELQIKDSRNRLIDWIKKRKKVT
jgi:broad specificity phosphatase PhoE